MNFFTNNIEYLIRLEKGLSQNGLGEKIGEKRGIVGNWVREKSKPSIDQILNISNYFKISVDHLLKTDLSKGIVLEVEPKTTTIVGDSLGEPAIPKYANTDLNTIIDNRIALRVQEEMKAYKEELEELWDAQLTGSTKRQLKKSSKKKTSS